MKARMRPAMTFDEIAARMGTSRQNVNQAYHSGLRKIRATFGDDITGFLHQIDRARHGREGF